MNNSIEGIVSSTLDRLKQMADVNTVVGKPIDTGQDCTIIPVSKVGVGFGVGGGEYNMKRKIEEDGYPFAGGSGAGVSITPVGFLIIKKDGVSMLPADADSPADRIAEMLPNIISTFKSNMKNRKCSQSGCDETTQPDNSGSIHY